MQISIEALNNLVLLINNHSQEKDRRILLGAAAKAYGHGGEQRIKDLTGVAFSTLHREKSDAEEALKKEDSIGKVDASQSESAVETTSDSVKHTGSKLKDSTKTMDRRERQRKVGTGRPSVLDLYPELPLHIDSPKFERVCS